MEVHTGRHLPGVITLVSFNPLLEYKWLFGRRNCLPKQVWTDLAVTIRSLPRILPLRHAFQSLFGRARLIIYLRMLPLPSNHEVLRNGVFFALIWIRAKASVYKLHNRLSYIQELKLEGVGAEHILQFDSLTSSAAMKLRLLAVFHRITKNRYCAYLCL